MEETQRHRALETISVIFAAVSGIVAVITLVFGWMMGNDLITRMSPGFSAMVPSTAVAFLCLSAALIFGWTCDRGWKALASYVLVFVAVILVLLNLAVLLLVHLPGIDSLLLGNRLGEDRMSAATGIGLLLAAYCIVAQIAPDNPDPELPTYVAVGGISTAAGVIGGHLFDPDTLYALPLFDGMSFNTALCFSLLFLAVLAYPYERLGTELFRDYR